VARQHLELIPPVPGADFVRAREIQLRAILNQYAGRYDLVVVDPIALAFPVENENNNSEATQQYALFRELSQRFGTTFILAHNTGIESDRSRGASARRDRVDAEWIFKATGTSRRSLVLDKDRLMNLNTTLQFEFAPGLNYTLLSVKGTTPVVTKRNEYETRVLDALEAAGGRIETRGALEHALGITSC
jgi:hypothetical protein